MAFESLTDEFIEALISCPKKVINPRAREVLKPGHKQVNYIVHALDESGHEFQLFIRQNLAAGMEDDFSCGLLWDAPNGETLILCRYNGASHIHRNKIEDKTLNLKFHIHRATKKYIAANQNPDGFAYETDRYQTLDEALICLISDCNVDGLGVNPGNNQLDLFK